MFKLDDDKSEFFRLMNGAEAFETLISDLEYFNRKRLRMLAVPAHYLDMELAEKLSSEG